MCGFYRMKWYNYRGNGGPNGFSMMRITLYHGSNCEIRNPEIRVGKYTKYFGAGFYCTEIKDQAERWARRLSKSGQPGVLNVYAYDRENGLNKLLFDRMTDAWLDFIVQCRSGIPHSYDIVAGAMADDTIFNYIDDFISGVITRNVFWELARFKYPTHQI